MSEKTKKNDRIKEITDRLEAGIEEVFQSDEYIKWLTVMSRFHSYSLNNTILIAMQNPDATFVAGYNAWQNKFHRHVRKGEKGIRILAPTPYKKKIEIEKKDSVTGKVLRNPDGSVQTEIKEIVYSGFKVATVFDVSQTEGEELPTFGVAELNGDVYQFDTFFDALKQTCPVPIEIMEIEGAAKGYYHQTERRIAIKRGMSQLQTIKTAIHEMAHQRLHAIDPNKNKSEQIQEELSRNRKEVEAESIAYTICQHYGLDTSDYSFAYIAGWSKERESTELKASLNTIRRAASEMISEIDEHMQKLLSKNSNTDVDKKYIA